MFSSPTRHMTSRRCVSYFIASTLLFFLVFHPASAATLRVGPGQPYALPCAAIAAAAPRDIIEIAGGITYAGDACVVNANSLVIRGVDGRPHIDAAGANAQGKGTWVIAASNVTVENVEMSGARVPDQNGAALRLEGSNFTLRGSFLHDNENGVLSTDNSASKILIETSEFGYNGYGTGFTHNIYIGNVASLSFRGNFSHDANVGHNLKSRAQVNTVTYNRFSSTSSSGAGKPSYEIDLPNAGTSYVIGNVIQQPPDNANPALLAYGEEGASNRAQDLYVVNNTFLNDDASSGTFVLVGASVVTPVLLQNNIFGGTGTLITQATAIDRTNFRSAAPGFVDRANYDLHPTPNPLVVDAGSAPGVSASGVSLAPTSQYRHVASLEPRVNTGGIDIGAYEAVGPSTDPDPAGRWITCAAEGGTCRFKGTTTVRYGANNAYATRTATNAIGCSNAVFGDPIPGVPKKCQYLGAGTGGPVTPR